VLAVAGLVDHDRGPERLEERPGGREGQARVDGEHGVAVGPCLAERGDEPGAGGKRECDERWHRRVGYVTV
jgi:hypothetical protein